MPLWEAVDELISKPDATATPIFLTYFTERNDDLSQRRAYASGENGYVIGFDARKLAELGGPNQVYLFPVDYDEGRQNVLLDEIIKRLSHLYLNALGLSSRPTEKEWAKELVSFWLNRISPFAVGLKHKAFRDEQEWRLFQYCRQEDTVNFQFRQRRSFIRVTCHCVLASLSRIAVGDLLLKHGYSPDSVPVSLSDAPYRRHDLHASTAISVGGAQTPRSTSSRPADNYFRCCRSYSCRCSQQRLSRNLHLAADDEKPSAT
jgi:Protein of unknown function (DUF2971)